jgi:hypothetical protein
MYRAGLGLTVLGEFRDHDGFDGIILGRPADSYQLEFTHHHGHRVGGAPTQDNLLVFYYPAATEWTSACTCMTAAGFRQVPSYNPYWDISGQTFEDPDGYRVVLQNAPAPGQTTVAE